MSSVKRTPSSMQPSQERRTGPPFSPFRSGQSVTLGKNTITKTRTAYKKYLMSYPPYSLWNRERRAAMSVAEGEDIMNQA